MKFKEIVIERNFRISNDDQYAKERISASISLDDGEDEQKAMNLAREKIIENFKQAYPKVYTYLNFDETIQVNNWGGKLEIGGVMYPSKELPKDKSDYPKVSFEAAVPTEKINKGSIEDQINACTEIELPNGLKSFEMIASMNPKLKLLYQQKEDELIRKEVTKQMLVYDKIPKEVKEKI
jgi:hypothetical protein